MSDGTGLAEALVGLTGFRVLEVTELDVGVVIDIETTQDVVGCGHCVAWLAAEMNSERWANPCLQTFRRPASSSGGR